MSMFQKLCIAEGGTELVDCDACEDDPVFEHDCPNDPCAFSPERTTEPYGYRWQPVVLLDGTISGYRLVHEYDHGS